mmetsp:Transcript_12156/g.35578  ORF Transcript_12156/g.35578 Transcript_12156/m.35578 type:complete len:397 (+) Transcript_12156:1274-2464(+)
MRRPATRHFSSPPPDRRSTPAAPAPAPPPTRPTTYGTGGRLREGWGTRQECHRVANAPPPPRTRGVPRGEEPGMAKPSFSPTDSPVSWEGVRRPGRPKGLWPIRLSRRCRRRSSERARARARGWWRSLRGGTAGVRPVQLPSRRPPSSPGTARMTNWTRRGTSAPCPTWSDRRPCRRWPKTRTTTRSPTTRAAWGTRIGRGAMVESHPVPPARGASGTNSSAWIVSTWRGTTRLPARRRKRGICSASAVSTLTAPTTTRWTGMERQRTSAGRTMLMPASVPSSTRSTFFVWPCTTATPCSLRPRRRANPAENRPRNPRRKGSSSGASRPARPTSSCPLNQATPAARRAEMRRWSSRRWRSPSPTRGEGGWDGSRPWRQATGSMAPAAPVRQAPSSS